MITRTFELTKGTALIYKKAGNRTEEVEYTVSGKFSDEAKLEKAVAKYINSDTDKLVAVLSAYDASEMRGMTEEKFIANSVLMDKETRKLVKP